MDATTLTLIGLVLAVAVPLLVFALERQTTRNLWNRITGKGPISTAVVSGPIDYARRYIGLPEYVIPRTIDQIPVPPSQMEYIEERQKWADALDGVDARWTSVEVTMTGRSSEPVILHELRVEVLEREPPLEGVHITYGPLGEECSCDGSASTSTEFPRRHGKHRSALSGGRRDREPGSLSL
jgi:hypothetical protein